jgi:aspartate aminotransferase-like enzyme
VNVVTSSYGGYFGTWLRRGGADVTDVIAEPGKPITIAAVTRALDALPTVGLIAVVHAESANGSLNPLPEIAALAKARGALLVVDAVASFGGHALAVDELSVDVAVVGPQKALGGPTALSVVSVSPRAWEQIAQSKARLSPSSLALSDIRDNWLDRGRGAPPGMPAALEFWALDAAIARIAAEGLANVIARHALAARASRAGLRALGIAPWITDDAAASALVTAAPIPRGISSRSLVDAAAAFGVALSPAPGDMAERLIRLDHTGPRAAFPVVLANVLAYGDALQRLGQTVDIAAAGKAVTEVYDGGLDR